MKSNKFAHRKWRATMQNETRKGTAEMTAAMLISGTIGWFVVMSGQPASNVVFWRCLFGAMSLLIICSFFGFLRPGVINRKAFVIAVAGGIAIVINWLLLFASYSHANISVSTTVYNTQPFMLLGLGALFLKEKVTRQKIFWLTLSFAGMILIIKGKPQTGDTSGNYIEGVFMAIGAAFFYALAALAAKWLKGTPPHLIALIQVSTGIIMLAPLTDFSVIPQTTSQWSMVISLGILHTGIMYILLYGAIQKLPTHLTGALSFIYPIAAIFVDRIAFGHSLQAMQIIGVIFILFSAAAINLGWAPAKFLRPRFQ